MKKIAIHQPRASYVIGGAETISIEMAKELSKFYDITFVTTKAKNTQIFQYFYNKFCNKIKFIFIESPTYSEFIDNKKLSKFDFESITFGENSSEFYEKNQFDFIVIHYCVDIITLNKKHSKIILHEHGYPKEKRFINEISYKNIDFIVTCSKFSLEKTLKFFPWSKDKICYYHMRPNFDDFIKNKRLKRKNIDILYVGRLIERKGVNILIKSLKTIENDFNKCIIAGGGPEENRLKQIIKDLKLENKIYLLGFVERNKVIDLMSRSKIFVHPALSREPFPTTLIEAMSIKLPIISTHVGGIPEIISNKINGLIINPNNDEELSKAISILLKNKKLYKQIQKGESQKIKKDFNKYKKNKEFLKLYTKIIGILQDE